MSTSFRASALLAITFVLSIAAISPGCARRTQPQPTDAEQQGRAVVNRVFIPAGEDSWCALQVIGSKKRLIQLHRPHPALNAQVLSEADRMNGISERYTLSVSGAQYRYWDDGRWSDWQQGVDGFAAALGSMFGAGQWAGVLERRNGVWSFRRSGGFIADDRPQLEELVRKAFSGK